MSSVIGSDCVLTWVSDGVASEHQLVGERTMVGRAKGCDLCFPFNEEISRLHASIVATDEGWMIEDVTSRSGTFVNGERILEPLPLHDGDEITIGTLQLTLKLKKYGQDTVDVGAGISVEDVERRAAELAEAAANIDTNGLKETADSQPIPVGEIPGVNDGKQFHNFYELIDVENFSDDSKQIHDKAMEKHKELRRLQDAGEGGSLREQIGAVSEAMIWLTNSSKKRHYDEQLAQRMGMDVQIVGNRAVPVQRPEGWQIALTIVIVAALLGVGGWLLLPMIFRIIEEFLGQFQQAAMISPRLWTLASAVIR